jgi:hypothetical protein
MPRRLYYANQQGAIAANNSTSFTAVRGLQSVGMNLTMGLSQVFEYAQQAIFENIEDVPQVEITLEKVLDGHPLIYHLATVQATSPTLAGRSDTQCKFAMSLFEDTSTSVAGSPTATVQHSGMYVSSVSYNFPIDDNATEQVTLVGNDRIWANDPNVVNPAETARVAAAAVNADAAFANNDDSPAASAGVSQRENIQFDVVSGGVDSNGVAVDPDCTVLPKDIDGISSSGTNDLEPGTDYRRSVLQNISMSVDFGRSEINQLGKRGPYFRYVEFPVEVTTEIEVITRSGDFKSATEAGILGTGTAVCDTHDNLVNQTIRVATCEGTRVYVGKANKLASIGWGGGDTAGGNVSTTYTYTTFNDFVVIHSGDPNASGTAWWNNRASYLAN